MDRERGAASTPRVRDGSGSENSQRRPDGEPATAHHDGSTRTPMDSSTCQQLLGSQRIYVDPDPGDQSFIISIADVSARIAVDLPE